MPAPCFNAGAFVLGASVFPGARASPASVAGGGAAVGVASLTSPCPGPRRFTFSTTTTLERPWEKL